MEVELRSRVFPLVGRPRRKTVTGKDAFVRGYWRIPLLISFLVEPSARDLSDSSCVFIPAAPMGGLNNIKSRATDSTEFGCWWGRQESNLRAQR